MKPVGRKVSPVGARITAVHVSCGPGIEGIRPSFERNGLEREMPLRAKSNGRADTALHQLSVRVQVRSEG